MKTVSLIMTLILILSGCASVHIHGNDGTVRTHREFGVLKIGMTPKSGAQTVTLRGVGMVSTPLTNAVGYHSASLVALPYDGCRLVVYADNDEQLAHLEDLLGSYNDVCTATY